MTTSDQELVEIFSDMFDLVRLRNFLLQDLSYQNEILFKFKNLLKIKDPAELNKIIKLLPNFGFFKNIFSEYLWCTPMYAKKMGFENPEDLIGQSDLSFPWSFSMATAYQDADEIVLLATEATQGKEQWVFEEDDQNIIVSMHRYPIFDQQNQVIGVLGVGKEDVVSTRLAKMAAMPSSSQALV